MRRVMKHPGLPGQSANRAGNQIPFGWMEITTGGIYAWRPAHLSRGFPRRQREAVEEELVEIIDALVLEFAEKYSARG